MKNTVMVTFLLMLCAASNLLLAKLNEGATGVLAFQCSYDDSKALQPEAVIIEKARQHTGKAASTKVFQRGVQSQKTSYLLNPGQLVECVFPSGNKVRAKVGEGTARPYGACGAEPEIFVSV